MPLYDSAYLLKAFNRRSGRPKTDAVSDADKYERLTDAQNRVVAQLAAIAPRSLYPRVGTDALPQLVTTDNQVFTFGTDASGYAVYPMGKGGIFSGLNDIPDFPLVEGVDYMLEGTQIRVPGNHTISGPLYWYGVTQPPDITAVVQPVLFPEASRELIVIEAVRQFAQEYMRKIDLADEMANEWERAWGTWCLAWRTQFRNGGALRSYTGLQLAVASQYIGA